MSLRLSTAAIRTYDALKAHPRATPRRSDARDAAVLELIHTRIRELTTTYLISSHYSPQGGLYVFWTEIDAQIWRGAFDDLLPLL